MDDKSAYLAVTGRYYRQYPRGEPLGHAYHDLKLCVDQTVFLLIDVYGQQFDPSFAADSEVSEFYREPTGGVKKEVIENRIIPAKKAARDARLRVAYVANYLSPGMSSETVWRNLAIRTCNVDVLDEWQPPTPVLEHMDAIAPAPDEPLIRKQYYSGFFQTELDSLLRGWGAQNLVVVGFDSRVCLAATVTDAMYRNYQVIVLRDAVRTTEHPETADGELANLLAIRFIESSVGYTVTTDEFLAACAAV